MPGELPGTRVGDEMLLWFRKEEVEAIKRVLDDWGFEHSHKASTKEVNHLRRILGMEEL